MHSDAGSTSLFSSLFHNHSTSYNSSIATKSLHSSWSVENHHIVNHDTPSPCQVNQAHSHSESTTDICHHPVKGYDSIYATSVTLANKKIQESQAQYRIGNHTIREHLLVPSLNIIPEVE
jgi:hypothetical protein